MDFGFVAVTKKDKAASETHEDPDEKPPPPSFKHPAVKENGSVLFGMDDSEPYELVEGVGGYKAYLLIICRKTRYVWLFLTKSKDPPDVKNNVIFMDGGGKLAGSKLF